MKKAITVLTIIAALGVTLTGCGNSVAIIGGSDGPTAIYLSESSSETTSDTTSENKLPDFTYTLDNCSYKDYILNEEMPDFFDDEQKKLFANAEYLIQAAYIDPSFNISYDYADCKKLVNFTGDEYDYVPMGVSCDSFSDYVTSVFTEDAAKKYIFSEDRYMNVDGELYSICAGGGGNPCYTGRSFELVSQSDTEIKFNVIAHYDESIFASDDEGAETTEAAKYDESYGLTIVKTDSGWRFSEFDDYWL